MLPSGKSSSNVVTITVAGANMVLITMHTGETKKDFYERSISENTTLGKKRR
jgi:hypothetical protein